MSSYEWDENKRRTNVSKHGVDFAEIEAFDWDTAVISATPRGGEMRWSALGYIGGRLHALAFTYRGARIRIISLRKANPREERQYAET
ncbi:MAG: BrnT family toxin [Alphaproteobacteria bacterium]|jgi:uncharacterized protein|nr:BrnT family toxin [Alphaproteobacteria bacterium]